MDSTRNLRVASSAAFVAGFSANLMFAVWQPFVLQLGVPMSTLGLLESLGGRRGLAGALIQPVGGWLSDRLGRKPLIVLGSVFTMGAVSLFALSAIGGEWRWLLPGVVFLGLALVSNPGRISLVGESTETSQRGAAYGVWVAAWVAPGVVAPALGGLISDRWGFPSVFVLRVALELLVLLVVVRMMEETRRQTGFAAPVVGWRRMLARLIVPPRELRGFFLAVATDSFVWALGSALLFGMLSREFGFSTAQLGVLFGLSSFVWAASQRLFGQWVDRYGCKWFLVLSDVLGLLVVAGWLFSRSYAAFAVTYACHGLVSATWTPAYMSFVAHSLSEEQRGEVMGRLAALRGLVRFPAPYLGGQLYDHLGFRAPLLANWIGLLVALAVLVFLVKEPRHHEEAP